MELEQELQRVLHTRDTALPVADPVAAVHAGMRRRRRVQGLTVLAAGVAVAAVVTSATLLAGNPLADHSPVTPATSEPSLLPSPQPSTQPSSEPSSEPTSQPTAAVEAVPAGFVASDVSFADGTGWALGTAPCPTGTCTVLAVTSDSGATWAPSTARGLPDSCDGIRPCVTHLRFADDRVGYAYGEGFTTNLYVTTDAGRTWSDTRSGAVYGLGIADDRVTRVVSPVPGCGPSCSFQVQTSAVGSAVSRNAFTAEGQWVGTRVTSYGSRAAVALLGHLSGGAEGVTTPLLLSTDGGQTWTQRDDPCPSTGPTNDIALGPGGVLAALCVPRTSDQPGTAVRLSTDSGHTFGPERVLPGRGVHVLVLGPTRLLAEVIDGGRDVLLLTEDAGVSWKDVASQPIANGGRDTLLSASGTSVTWVGPDRTRVWRSADAGATWESHTFG